MDYLMPTMSFGYSKYLTASSFLLAPPVWVALRHKREIAPLYALIFLTSVNYWRAPVYGFRRTLDVVAVRVTVGAAFWHGYHHAVGVKRAAGYASLGACALLYGSSWYLHANRRVAWIAAHMALHLSAAAGLVLAIC